MFYAKKVKKFGRRHVNILIQSDEIRLTFNPTSPAVFFGTGGFLPPISGLLKFLWATDAPYDTSGSLWTQYNSLFGGSDFTPATPDNNYRRRMPSTGAVVASSNWDPLTSAPLVEAWNNLMTETSLYNIGTVYNDVAGIGIASLYAISNYRELQLNNAFGGISAGGTLPGSSPAFLELAPVVDYPTAAMLLLLSALGAGLNPSAFIYSEDEYIGLRFPSGSIAAAAYPTMQLAARIQQVYPALVSLPDNLVTGVYIPQDAYWFHDSVETSSSIITRRGTKVFAIKK